MEARTRTPEETYGPALEKAQRTLAQINPGEAAVRAGASLEELEDGGAQFVVRFLGILHHIRWPDGAVFRACDGEQVDIATRIILLHYLLTADGAPVAGSWIAFRNLPGGLGYEAAFQGRASLRLARRFGSDAEAFRAAARLLGGETLAYGDASFLFRVLPRIWMAAVIHLADEEFPARANVLFDANASHCLPTEDLAVLGGILASKLVKTAGRS
jgi:hypothetical protein